MPPRARQAAPPAAAAAGEDVDNNNNSATEPIHKFTFVQALMQREVMTLKDAKALLTQLNPQFNDAAWQQLVVDINQEMDHMSLRVKVMLFPHDNNTYVGFINVHVDESSKLASKYKHPEREYFKAVLEAIAQEEALAETGIAMVSSMQLLNLEAGQGGATQAGGSSQAGPSTQATGSKSKLSKAERQQLLKTLVADHWLAEDDDGGVCIGVRSFMELSDFLSQLAPAETKEAWRKFL